jgi:hypothetical protein
LRDDGWGCESPLPKATPKPARTPAKEYSRPELSRVSVGLEADDDSFAPGPSDRFGMSVVCAKIPSGSMRISEGGHAVVDCGFGISIPPGYRVRVSGVVPGLAAEVHDTGRFRLSLVNLGGETILNDGQQIGLIWVEPVCYFDWTQRG